MSKEKRSGLPRGWGGGVMRMFGRGYGLHYFGRDEQGVPVWDGGWNNLPQWLISLFVLLTFGLACASTVMLFASKGPLEAMPVVLATAVIGGVTFWMSRFRRSFEALTPPDKVADSLGVTMADVGKLAEEHGIKPRAILNRMPVYNLADFGEAGLLLRASQADEAAPLLRPAAAGEGENETLLRAAPSVEAEEINAQTTR